MVMVEDDPATNSFDEGANNVPEWENADDIDDLEPGTPTHSTPEPQDGASAEGTAKSAAVPPMQKRRRVTRACDECRRKKIKCDGKQPCTHCTVYSYECTYDQPSNRRRNAAPQYIEALEKRMKQMESILRIILPDTDYEDPSLVASLRQGTVKPKFDLMTNGPAASSTSEKRVNGAEPAMDSQLESMVKSTGQLDLDEEGHWDYHGHSSGLSFVRRMREQFPDIISEPIHSTPFVKSRPLSQKFDSPRLDSPRSTTDSPFDGNLATADLPSRLEARAIVEMAINDAASLLRIVHEPSVWRAFDRIYDLSPDQYKNEDHVFLPLLYAILALGSLFSRDDQEIDNRGYLNAIDQGFKYFKMARQLMDIADCRDLPSLQAILFMILFLQSSAKLSTCYSYIGVALRSALRMGLHRNFACTFNPIESEVRKRVFWVIRKLDTYVGALLGLPHTMNDEDIDQEFPSEVDDEFITEKGILKMPPGRVSVMAAFNAHTHLVAIIAKIVKYIYPLKGSVAPSTNDKAGAVKSYSVGYARIREIELDLQEWMQKLPMGLRPGGDAPKIIIRVQQLLRMAYAHAQMMLYRPFLHYVSHTCKSKVIDKRSYACAAACVSVSRNVIHINTEMKKRGLLCGAHWFSMYTAFFAILSLVFFALENPDNPTSQEVLRDAKEGKDTLAELARRSMAADRCTGTLNVLFEQLPERLKRGRAESLATKKRRQETSPRPLAHSRTGFEDVTMMASPKLSDVSKVRRASTFHGYGTGEDSKPLSQTVPLAQAQLGNDSPFNYPNTPQLVDSVASLTPSSVSTSTLPFNMPNQASVAGLSNNFGGLPLSPNMVTSFGDPNMPLPDLSSMMFPSGDPFAYPHQQGLTSYGEGDFDPKELGLFPRNNNSDDSLPGDQFAGGAVGASNQPGNFIPPSSTFMPRNTSQGDVDVQLFGPVPMYQMQGMRNNGNTRFDDSFSGAGEQGQSGKDRNTQSADQLGQNGVTGMNLDELFGGEEWAGMFDANGSLNNVARDPYGVNGMIFR